MQPHIFESILLFSTITWIVQANQPGAEVEETAREESLEDLIDKGRTLVNYFKNSGLAGKFLEKCKIFKGQASGSERKAGTYGVPSEDSKEGMNLDDPTQARPLGPLKAKIRPKDYPDIWFSTTKVLRFLEHFEVAVNRDGALDLDKVWQVVKFIQDEEVLRDVEDMKGYEKKD
ncbi:hypothetical protein PGTUg99_028114 [Puccinia graminis f. sp. tritici]|uniref:Uncharacterized protein n=1 Tax=Puccinia graminis f. sp. tritici TaxID=56615 RepID=A0A5B0MCH4_PUCGR|nr:hypothetical protein PGTUg99_028114 [Puccinia graminis f. sp. tritici]